MNQIKTVLLLGLLSGLMLLIGGAIGGKGGLFIALLFALIMNVGSYWYSDKIVLSMYRAREVGPNDAPALHRMVEELCREAGLPKPRIYIIPQEAPNAFATGRNPEHAAVAVTQGILKLLSAEELRGVLGHELGHVKHRDILIQTVAGIIASVITYLANFAQFAAIFGMGGRDDEGGGNPFALLLMAIVAPFAAMIIQMAISRSREYLADEAGGQFSHNPNALASALEKLQAYGQRIPMRGANEATAAMFIVHPFTGQSLARLFSTHPPTEERVRRLRAMAGRV